MPDSATGSASESSMTSLDSCQCTASDEPRERPPSSDMFVEAFSMRTPTRGGRGLPVTHTHTPVNGRWPMLSPKA
eukprot:744228-Prymnesium_polylepis.1